jgi:membrane protease YdiL (CAAX protease family)
MNFLIQRIFKNMNLQKKGIKCVQLTESILALAGVYIFSMFIHSNSIIIILAFLGLIITAISINHAADDLRSLGRIFGITPVLKKVALHTIIGVTFGCLLGILYRHVSRSAILPSTLTKIAIISPVIGITEELLFRGFILGRMRPFGKIISVLYAAAGHSLYKYLLLISLSFDTGINFPVLITLTFFVGIILGVLRVVSSNIIPAASAHACFDVLVYGGYISAPVWVWA